MRLDNIIQTLIIFSSIPCGISRPSLGRRTGFLKTLSRRTPYAIIPVDGGASSNFGNDSPSSSITPTTFTTVAVAATQTSIETDIITLPPVTNYITTTLTVEGSTITQMTQVTVTTSANPTTITKISYSIIDISSSSQQFSTSTYSSTAASKSSESLIFPSSSSISMTVSPTQFSKSDPLPPQTTVPSMSSQNSTQPASTGLPVNNSTFTTLGSPSNSSSVTYLPYHEPNSSSLTTNKPTLLPSS